jgi:hypothetical protein
VAWVDETRALGHTAAEIQSLLRQIGYLQELNLRQGLSVIGTMYITIGPNILTVVNNGDLHWTGLLRFKPL